MKKVLKDKIINIKGTDFFDKKFLFEVLSFSSDKPLEPQKKIKIFFISKLLEKRKNEDILEKVKNKPAMYSNVYSPKDELEIFKELFEYAITKKQKIHIIGITLKEELEVLEEYYEKLGFLRKDINCFSPNFSKSLISVSVNIENLLRKGSDYKSMGKKIFFNPPIRESGQAKAMFKGINRGVIAGIFIKKLDGENEKFLSECIKKEKILAITLAKVLKFNLEKIGFEGINKQLVVQY